MNALCFLKTAGPDILIGGNVRAANVNLRAATRRVYATMQRNLTEVTIVGRMIPAAANELSLPQRDFESIDLTDVEYADIETQTFQATRDQNAVDEATEDSARKAAADLRLDALGFPTDAGQRANELSGILRRMQEADET